MQELELLEAVWGIVREWEGLYGGWKDAKFGDIDVEAMEEAAARISKAITRLGRDIKAWPVWGWVRVSGADT